MPLLYHKLLDSTWLSNLQEIDQYILQLDTTDNIQLSLHEQTRQTSLQVATRQVLLRILVDASLHLWIVPLSENEFMDPNSTKKKAVLHNLVSAIKEIQSPAMVAKRFYTRSSEYLDSSIRDRLEQIQAHITDQLWVDFPPLSPYQVDMNDQPTIKWSRLKYAEVQIPTLGVSYTPLQKHIHPEHSYDVNKAIYLILLYLLEEIYMTYIVRSSDAPPIDMYISLIIHLTSESNIKLVRSR